MPLSTKTLPALLAALILTLAACGGDDSDDSTSQTKAAGFPVEIDDKFGTTTIGAPPKRVATVGFNEQDFALALGVKPVAVRQYLGSFDYKTRPWAPDQGKPQEVGGADINYERLAGARPDLVLGIYSFIKDGDYKKLSEIAPTVAQGKQYPDGATPWDQQLLLTGKALGREDKARQVVQDVKQQFAAARADHPEFKNKTISVMYDSGGSRFVLNRDDLRSQFFADLGFETPAKYSKRGFETNLSDEQLSLLDTDVIVLISDPGSTLASSKLFKELEPAREGRVVALAGDGLSAGALGYNSPLSRPYLLKRIVSQLAAAVDGDPATKVPPDKG